MKVDQYCVILQIFHQQNLGTKQETFFMHLQFHKTLLFPMARWLTDCPYPKVTGKITDKYMENLIFVLHLLVIKKSSKTWNSVQKVRDYSKNMKLGHLLWQKTQHQFSYQTLLKTNWKPVHGTFVLLTKKNPGFSFVPKEVAGITACLYQLVV